ncbi:MAG: ACT domain-containing protein [Chloroflexota bacterium]
MPQTADEILAGAALTVDDRAYVFVRLHPRAVTLAAGIVAEVGEPYTALVVDKDEVTLVLPDDLLEEFSGRLREHAVLEQRYRLVTVDVVMEPSIVGVMARLSAALAADGISLMAFAAYSRDHLLVPVDQLPKALQALQKITGTT